MWTSIESAITRATGLHEGMIMPDYSAGSTFEEVYSMLEQGGGVDMIYLNVLFKRLRLSDTYG